MNCSIGNNLKLLREANQFSQEQVSAFLGIKRSTYSNYETGDREAPLDILEKCSHLYGCDLSLILEENPAHVNEMLVCSFRTDHINEQDMKEIAHFKEIVKNYIKLNNIIHHGSSLI